MKHLRLWQLDRRHLQLVWVIFSLALFLLGSGAPSGVGGTAGT